MRLRSPRELVDRFLQEASNIRLAVLPTHLPHGVAVSWPVPGLPDPREIAALLSPTAFPKELAALCQKILAHQFPALGVEIDTGPEIAWRRDYGSGRETPPSYFRLVPYLDPFQVGDHKMIWELNRHQHLVVLAQGALFDSDPALTTEIWNQIESWILANPFQRGINWASALEVGFRALSWLWIFHLVGDRMPESLKPRFLETLYWHGCHLAVNLSYYFSPNTHLLGEAVALHALGVCAPQFPGASEWAAVGGRVVAHELNRQVRPDGGHFEQSTYYHVYALDMFLFHAVLSEPRGQPDTQYREALTRMGNLLDALLGTARMLPQIGDDDGGRFFYPFGPRERFGRATVAMCAQWLGRTDWTYAVEDLYPLATWWVGRANGSGRGAPASHFFSDTGLAVMAQGPHQVVFDAGPFGPWGAGHSHSDTLSLVIRTGDEEILIDPGTYTYVGSPEWRNRFRGSAAHNTVSIDSFDQAEPSGPFRWKGRPDAKVRSWMSTADLDELDAECSYRRFLHRRRVRFHKAGLVTVLDEIQGPAEEHVIEQHWHLASARQRPRLLIEQPADEEDGWRSTVFGVKTPAPVVIVRRRTTLPVTLGAVVLLDPALRGKIVHQNGVLRFCFQNQSGTATIEF